ncbi:MAG TPA: cytochrome c [Herbaspirillum sp.]|jgi:ubiquinol-cytochrome c reductase cytochrome c subunit
MKTFKKTGGLNLGLNFGLKLAITLGILTAIAPAMAQSNAKSDQVKHGEVLYESNGCYMCHGTVGQGGVGPAVAVDLIPYAGVAAYVRHPTGDMPPFSEKVLSDADLHDIYAYLSVQPEPKNPDSIPLLPKVKPVSSGSK